MQAEQSQVNEWVLSLTLFRLFRSIHYDERFIQTFTISAQLRLAVN
jgi:hypothetical protein